MVTDNERREVAENLRTMCAYGVRYKEQFFDLLEETVMNVEDFHEFANVAERLADLIEPTDSFDLDALRALADEMDEVAQRRRSMGYEGFAIGDEDRARRIREACGERAS